MNQKNCQEIRLALRAKRQALTLAQRKFAAHALFLQSCELPLYQNASKIGFYMALPEEINPATLLLHSLKIKKNVYLPVIQEKNTMRFVHYQENTPLITNRYGIVEPDPTTSDTIDSTILDLVFVPLVGFDRKGHRLGMGAGFYDKHFAFLKEKNKPLLIGLAFDCQEYTGTLPQNEWDISLDGIITETRFIATTEL
jgi:5-formyltetrahydrofolate cyclo-ligase